MTVERMLELLVLNKVCDDYQKDKLYSTFLDNNYDMKKLGDRYIKLGREFLNDYALDKTEKSD